MKAALTFGGWLKRRRGGLGLTQKELAQMVGYAEVTLRKAEADELRPSRQMAEKLAEVLQIAPEERAQFVRFARDEAGWGEVALTTQETSAVPSSTTASAPAPNTSQHTDTPRHRAPLERPPRTEHFQGRKAELHKLLADLQPGRVVTLCGPGGIGKSALAAEAVWQLAPSDRPPQHFPDGILFHSFYNQSQAALALEHIARSFGEELKPTPKAAAQRALSGRCFLLCLDGAEEADDLRQVLDIRDQCGVLVTSRLRKDAVDERQDIAPLPQADAVPLIQAWGGVRAADKTAVGRISELVGRLPLALRLIGRYLAENEENASDYLAWLTATPLAALDQGRRREESVPVLLARSLTQVSEQARQVMGVIGLLALAPFAWEPIAAALALPVVDTRQALGELVNYGLLLRLAEMYEVAHALMHTYARERLSPFSETMVRLVTYYIAFSRQHRDLGITGFGQLAFTRPHLVTLVRHCLKQEIWKSVNDLVWMIQGYLDLQGYWLDRVTILQAGLIATRVLQNHQAEGIYLGYLGMTYDALGQYRQAIEYNEQALTIAQEIGDRANEGAWLGSLGNSYHGLGQYQKSIQYHEQALAIAQEIDDRHGEAVHGGNLGSTYNTLGEYQRAIEYHEQALAIAQEIGDRRTEGIRLGHLGSVYTMLGEYQRAIEYYEQALAIAQEIGDRHREGIHRGNLGRVHTTLGEYQRAIEYHEQALTIAQEIGDRRKEGIHLGNLGIVYTTFGEYQRAIEYIEQGLQIAREISHPLSEAFRLYELAIIYRALTQVERARQYWEQSLCIFERIKSPRAEEVRELLASLKDV